jgi:hypothetical protein
MTLSELPDQEQVSFLWSDGFMNIAVIDMT